MKHPLNSFRFVVVVTIEYDCRGARVRKTFDCPFAARRFYTAKDRAGKRPTVVKT